MRREPTVPVALAGAAAFLGLYCTQPLLPLLARTFDASTFAVSLTVTAPTVAIALAAPLIGRLADTIGLRRVIVGSAFLLAAATGLTATSTTLRQLIVWRFFQGIVTPGVFACTVAYIHEMWPSSRTGRATAGYMTGTILGGFTGRATAGLIAASANWHLSFVALGAIAMTIAIVLALRLPVEPSAALRRHDGAAPRDTVHFRDVSARLFRNRPLVATYAIGFCVLFTSVAMFTFVTFHLASPPYGLSTAALAWLFVVYLIGAVVTPFGGRWIDAYGHRTGLAAAMGIGGIGAVLTLLPYLPAILVGLTLASTGVFVAQTTTSSHIGTATTEDRALAVGLYSTFYYTGGSLGAVAPAVLWRTGGWPACVAVVVAVQAIGVWIALTFWSATQEAGEPHPETLSA